MCTNSSFLCGGRRYVFQQLFFYPGEEVCVPTVVFYGGGRRYVFQQLLPLHYKLNVEVPGTQILEVNIRIYVNIHPVQISRFLHYIYIYICRQ